MADTPTPLRRGIAALVAGSLAFALAQILLGIIWGAGWRIAWASGFACAVAAGYAAGTLRRGLAIVYGLLAAVWLLVEGFVLLLGSLSLG
ncbi:hypothetical protein [Sphingomonas sp.]|uniref:hypothetical protein n=1 Tax=Sphingomonas sp. TaxID=28214 RepID=UPI0025DADA5E|nr:hypothetical protein [Sphingomonas sp.]